MDEEVNEPYYTLELSKDYERLYELLCLGYELVGFIDYVFTISLTEDPLKFRDVCTIRRKQEFAIDFGVRGKSYGGVHYKANIDEKTEFLEECKRLDLEYIK